MKSDQKRMREKKTFGDVFPKHRIYMLDNGRSKRVRVEGAKKLLLCLDKEVKVSLGTEVLRVEGTDLSCINYASGAVEISGNIGAVFFDARAGRE